MSKAINLREPAPRAFDVFAQALIQTSRETPYFHLEGYMERFWIQVPPGMMNTSDTSDRWKTGHGARIHHILRSDDDRHLHDHPWSSTSIVLIGGYLEVMPTDPHQEPAADEKPGGTVAVWRSPGDVVHRDATSRHRLIIPANTTAWSLFLMGDYEQGWGFYTPNGKVPWREYLGMAPLNA